MSEKLTIVKKKSIKQLIDEKADRQPDAVFLIAPDEDVCISYADLRNYARTVSAHIANHGVAFGGAVAYAMENGAKSALCILGIYYGGYRATAINLVAGNDILAYVVEHSETQLILTQDQTLDLMTKALEGISNPPKIICVDDNFIKPLNVPIATNPSSESDALLMYTSGTTGRPKGVVLTHKNLLSGAANTVISHELTQADRALCVLPLYHINGMCVTLMAPLISGGSVVLPNKFSASNFWNILEAHKCTWFSVVPTHIAYLLGNKNDPSPLCAKNLRFGRSASAPLSPDTQKDFEDRFKIPMIETMGLTETSAQILSNPLPLGLRKIGSPGIAYGNQVIIADNQQNEIPHGQEGEILVRGDNVMRLYLKNEVATKESLLCDGWLRTGDLGKMDEDGYVFITGRLKELIIKGGENISPREVDEALLAHPSILEAAAFPCACKNYGQTVEASVVISPGCEINETTLLKFCAEKIGKFKSPDKIHFMDDLPKGPSGKIQRLKVQEKATSR